MGKVGFYMLAALVWFGFNTAPAQSMQPNTGKADTGKHAIYDAGNLPTSDSMPTIDLRPVNIIAFKSMEQWNEYYKYRNRIIKVMPYVKVAKQLYADLMEEEANAKKREFRHYRKDIEKEMRTRFEKELKDLTIGQGEMLFKLINRETGNNCYRLIKDTKGPFAAWFYQALAKHWGYDLKDNYDPKKEKMIELIIAELGPAYNV